MSASTAIGMVGSSLRNLLLGELALGLDLGVTILAPDEHGDEPRVNLFLYRIEENPYLRNQEPTVRPDATDRLFPTPLSLVLFYLVTVYASNDTETGNTTAHQILGSAMRVFHDNGVVPAAYLDDGLTGARERLQIVGKSLDPEELSRIWSTFSQPFRLSVLYQVSTVQLDARTVAPIPVPQRVRTVGVPDVRQPPDRPVVLDLAPRTGAPGDALTLTGQHLTGWRASASIGGRTVFSGQRLSGDSVTVTLPPATAPGWYDVRVDVAGLFRRTFLVEVTP
jgi:hypothetical protein